MRASGLGLRSWIDIDDRNASDCDSRLLFSSPLTQCFSRGDMRDRVQVDADDAVDAPHCLRPLRTTTAKRLGRVARPMRAEGHHRGRRRGAPRSAGQLDGRLSPTGFGAATRLSHHSFVPWHRPMGRSGTRKVQRLPVCSALTLQLLKKTAWPASMPRRSDAASFGRWRPPPGPTARLWDPRGGRQGPGSN